MTDPKQTLLADETIQALIDQFDARLVSAHNDRTYWGELNVRVQYGVDEKGEGLFVKLPPVTFASTVDKADLEREAIPSMFAHYLAGIEPGEAASIGKGAAQYNSKEFMNDVRDHYKFFVAMRSKLTTSKN